MEKDSANESKKKVLAQNRKGGRKRGGPPSTERPESTKDTSLYKRIEQTTSHQRKCGKNGGVIPAMYTLRSKNERELTLKLAWLENGKRCKMGIEEPDRVFKKPHRRQTRTTPSQVGSREWWLKLFENRYWPVKAFLIIG